MNVLFWLSIGLWVLALVCYAMILSADEQRHGKGAGTSTFTLFETLFHTTGGSRARRYLYRIQVAAALGAMLTGGLYLLTRTS
jgi:hypothetical protein